MKRRTVAALVGLGALIGVGQFTAQAAHADTPTTTVSWVIPSGYKGAGPVLYPQTLLTATSCGDLYVQTDVYQGTPEQVAAVTADGRLDRNEDQAIYVSHTITKEPACATTLPTSNPTPTPSPTSTPSSVPVQPTGATTIPPTAALATNGSESTYLPAASTNSSTVTPVPAAADTSAPELAYTGTRDTVAAWILGGGLTALGVLVRILGFGRRKGQDS